MRKHKERFMQHLLIFITIVCMLLTIAPIQAKESPKLSAYKKSINVNDGFTLKIEGTRKAKWTASNSNVTLSSKKNTSVYVKGKKTGTTYVYAKAGGKKLKCTVTVKKSSTVKVSYQKKYYMLYDWENDESLEKKDSNGKNADEHVLSLITNKKATVKWKSGNTKILKIGHTTSPDIFDDEYEYTASIKYVKFGTSKVYAYVNGKKYTFTVTLAKSAIYYAAKKVIAETIKPGMDDAHKAYAIGEWIVNNVEYDKSYIHIADPRRNVLIDHKGVCQDYADGYAYILSKTGIKARTVSSTSMNHAWSQVCINGKWANVDLTMTTAYKMKKKKPGDYFMKSDAYMIKKDIASYVNQRDNKKLTAANTDYDYYSW